MIKYLIFGLSVVFIAWNPARSQQLSGAALKAYRLRQIQSVYEEKLHRDDAVDAGKNEGNVVPLLSNDTNERVSTSYPESEVHAAINPTDTANIVTGAIHLNGSMTLPIYYSTIFGGPWHKSGFNPAPYQSNALIAGGGDPVFAYDKNGTVYMSWIDLYELAGSDSIFAGMYWASSTNGGQTWVQPAKGYIGSGFEVSNGGVLDTSSGIDDKEWIAVDRSNSPYRNTLYAAWTHLGYSNYGVMVRRKLPGVDSMEPPVRVTPANFIFVQYTSIGIDAHGGVHVTYEGSLDTVNYAIYESYSSDGGKTFQAPVKISDADIPGVSQDATGDAIFGIRQAGNYPCAHLSIDTSSETGTLYEVWCALGVDANEGQGDNIYFSRSIDNGASWSPASIINNDVDTETNYIDHFYPSIAVDGKGKISVGWYDRREDIYDEIGRYYIGQSTDAGNTWTNIAVATAPTDFSDVMEVNQNFGIGEYTQVLATPNYTIPVWADGRDDHGQLRIYAAFLTGSPFYTGSAGVAQISSVSTGVELSENYPNPFPSATRVSFTVASSTHATLFVTNLAGAPVATLFDNEADAGEHDFTFDGSALAAGVYFLNLETGLGVSRRAMTVIH